MNRQFKRRQGRAAGGGNQSQAQQLQAQLKKLQELQEELETMTAQGTAGGPGKHSAYIPTFGFTEVCSQRLPGR